MFARVPRHDPVEVAWRIHDAQADWTGKVDNKAAFALSIHSLILTLSLAGATEIVEFRDWVVFGCGTALLLAGAVMAASVVAPRLRSRGLKRASRENYIYFGHARHWEPERLQRRLRREDPLPQLSRQIVVMAEIAWSKHVRVAWSIWLGVAGGFAVLVSALLARIG